MEEANDTMIMTSHMTCVAFFSYHVNYYMTFEQWATLFKRIQEVFIHDPNLGMVNWTTNCLVSETDRCFCVLFVMQNCPGDLLNKTEKNIDEVSASLTQRHRRTACVSVSDLRNAHF